MAHVAITDKLINEVRSKINHMRDKEIEAELPELSKSYPIDSSELFNLCAWGEHLHLKAVLPQEWTTKAGPDVTINIVRDGTKDSTLAQVRFTGATTAVAPPKSGWNTSYTFIHQSAVEKLPTDLTGVAELRKRLEDNKARQVLLEKWREIDKNIVDLLKQAPSLNAVVKAVPTLRMYITREYLERLDRKAEKAKAGPIEVKFDVDALTAAAVGAQLAGA